MERTQDQDETWCESNGVVGLRPGDCETTLGRNQLMKSLSEQLEEQLEPRPEPKTEAQDIVSLEPKPWDHTGKHHEIHEHTQD